MVLRINPENAHAQAALEKLGGEMPTPQEEPIAQEEPVAQVRICPSAGEVVEFAHDTVRGAE